MDRGWERAYAPRLGDVSASESDGASVPIPTSSSESHSISPEGQLVSLENTTYPGTTEEIDPEGKGSR